MKKALALAFSSALLFSQAACDSEGTDADPVIDIDLEPASHYVALGDSYAALGSADAETDECRRAPDNYPSLVRNATELSDGSDASCSGAVTAEVLDDQVEALSEDVDLVTLSIGGNDIGFPEIGGCFEGILTGTVSYECLYELEAMVDERIQDLPGQLDAVYAEIDERSPDAEIITTGYMPLMSTADECGYLSIIPGEFRQWAVDLTDDLNRLVREAAERHEAHYVIPEGAYDHTVCAPPEERWTDLLGNETNAHSMHPTPLGQQVMADTVVAEWDRIDSLM